MKRFICLLAAAIISVSAANMVFADEHRAHDARRAHAGYAAEAAEKSDGELKLMMPTRNDDVVAYRAEKNVLFFDKGTGTVVGGRIVSPKLEIPASIEGVKVIAIGESAFEDCGNVTEITIAEGITKIEEYAFSGCEGVKKISIPKSATEIGEGAFAWCYELTEINVDAGNEGYCSVNGVLYTKDKSELLRYPAKKEGEFVIPEETESIGSYAFSDCSYLTKITIPENVSYIEDGAFSGCEELTEIKINAGVEYIGSYAFEYCPKLERIEVEEANENYCSEDGVLYSKDRTELVCFPAKKAGEFVVPEGTEVIREAAFSVCPDLTRVTLPSSLTCIEYDVFQNAGITSIDIPGSIGRIKSYTFFSCNKLQSVNIGEGLTDIESGAFADCESLKEIDIPAGVGFIGDDAFHNSGIEKINVSSGNATYCSENGVLFSKDKKTLVCCPSKMSGEYTVPEGTEKIAEYAFSNCGNLEAVHLPDSLREIDLGAFNNCRGLLRIRIPAAVAKILNSTFKGCTSLESIEVDEANANYCSVDGVLYSKDKKTLVCCPQKISGVFVIPTGTEQLSGYAFEGNNLTKVVVPGTVTSLSVSNFSECGGIEQLDIYEGVQVLFFDVFSGGNLKIAAVPQSVEYIHYDEFLHEDWDTITFSVVPDSYAEHWAVSRGIKTSTYTLPSTVSENPTPAESKTESTTESTTETTTESATESTTETTTESTTESTTETTTESTTESTTETPTEPTTGKTDDSMAHTPAELVLGGASAKKTLSSADAAVILQKVLNGSYKMPIESVAENYKVYVDVNLDGELTSADSAIVLQKVLNSSFKMPIEVSR